MKISVIIPSYKPQKYLWQCLDSLCGQTFPKEDFEIILVLNGCKEPYDEQIKAYIEEHSNINWNYIQTGVPGVSNARNVALDVAQGEYVTFIDDDDYVSESYLEKLFDSALPNRISIARPQAFYDETGKIWDRYPIAILYEKYQGAQNVAFWDVRKFFSGPWAKLYPISVIANRRFNTKFKVGEDVLFNYLISDKIKRVNFTHRDAVYFRRFREDSVLLSGRSLKEKIVNNCRLIKEVIKIYLASPCRYSFALLLRTCLGLCYSAIMTLRIK